MKVFQWRLQRLLDIRVKQEDALRSELVGLTEQTTVIRGRILMEKAMLRSRLAELRSATAAERLTRQRDFMHDVTTVDTLIGALEADLQQLDQRRKEKIEAIMTVRKFRKALERLKAQAQQAHRRDENQQEQKDQDENAGIVVARSILEPAT